MSDDEILAANETYGSLGELAIMALPKSQVPLYTQPLLLFQDPHPLQEVGAGRRHKGDVFFRGELYKQAKDHQPTGLPWLHQGCQCEGDNREGVAGVPAEQVWLGEHGGPACGGRPAGGAGTLRLPQVWPPAGRSGCLIVTVQPNMRNTFVSV